MANAGKEKGGAHFACEPANAQVSLMDALWFFGCAASPRAREVAPAPQAPQVPLRDGCWGRGQLKSSPPSSQPRATQPSRPLP